MVPVDNKFCSHFKSSTWGNAQSKKIMRRISASIQSFTYL